MYEKVRDCKHRACNSQAKGSLLSVHVHQPFGDIIDDKWPSVRVACPWKLPYCHPARGRTKYRCLHPQR